MSAWARGEKCPRELARGRNVDSMLPPKNIIIFHITSILFFMVNYTIFGVKYYILW